MGVRSCLQWLAAACALVAGASAQLPIPGKPPGFTLGGGRADAGVQIESYIDLVRRHRFDLQVCCCVYETNSGCALFVAMSGQ